MSIHATLKELLRELWGFFTSFSHTGTVVTCRSYDIIQYLKAINYTPTLVETPPVTSWVSLSTEYRKAERLNHVIH